jgi:hypothetical protein
LTNVKPEAFKIFDEIHLVKNWREFYLKSIETIYFEFEEAFKKHLRQNSFAQKGKTKDLILQTEEKSYRKIVPEIYLYIPSSPVQILNNLVKFVKILKLEKLSEESIQIFLKK